MRKSLFISKELGISIDTSRMKSPANIPTNLEKLFTEAFQIINKLEKGGLSGKPLENKSNILINKFYHKVKN